MDPEILGICDTGKVGPSVPTSTLPQIFETESLLGNQINFMGRSIQEVQREQPKLFEYYERYIFALGNGSITQPPLVLG
jgi:hypothetical protein